MPPIQALPTDPSRYGYVPVPKAVSVNATPPSPPPAPALAPAPALTRHVQGTPPAPVAMTAISPVPSALQPATPPTAASDPLLRSSRVSDAGWNMKGIRRYLGGQAENLVLCLTHHGSFPSTWSAFSGGSCSFGVEAGHSSVY